MSRQTRRPPDATGKRSSKGRSAALGETQPITQPMGYAGGARRVAVAALPPPPSAHAPTPAPFASPSPAAAASHGSGWRQRLRQLSALQVALLASLAVHAAVLSVRFIGPENITRAFRDTPLEVILVNARSKEPPLQAQAIAQANLAGGGEADKGRATSPLPAAATVQLGESADDSKKRIEQLQDEQQQLLAQIRREIATLPPPDPSRDDGSPAEREKDERRRQLLRLLAEIEKRVNEENARPKKREVTTIWSALARMASLKGPKGAAARTMDSAWVSNRRDCELRTMSASITRPVATTVTFMVSSPYSFWPLCSGKLRVPRSSMRRRSAS